MNTALTPTEAEILNRARADLRAGVPIVAGRLIFTAAETITSDRLSALGELGDRVIAITARRAETLNARAYDGDIARIAMRDDADLSWVSSVADPASDLMVPLKGPFQPIRGGTADDFRDAIALAKGARLLPAIVGVASDVAQELARANNWVIIGGSGRLEAALDHIVSAAVPLAVSENTRLHVFRPKDGGEEHYAIEIGRPDRNSAVLARVHSACFTGDLLGSLKCDCGPQLNAALQAMGAEGAGVLLYLNQEGRGIGLANKMRAYALQDQGFDTVDANHRLGFEDDERDFRIGAQILKDMGFASARLLTNNPAKVAMLETCGVKVDDRVPLKVGKTRQNAAYLATKASKSGHLL